jgi:hypothetical protein
MIKKATIRNYNPDILIAYYYLFSMMKYSRYNREKKVSINENPLTLFGEKNQRGGEKKNGKTVM